MPPTRIPLGRMVGAAKENLFRWVWPLIWPLMVLGVLNLWIFADYYSGRSLFPWDFVGGYHSMVYAWYADGGFFSPPAWSPYTQLGYPSHLALQNGSFYLPIALLDWLGFSYTYKVATYLQCLHVLLGAVGIYVFLKSKQFIPLVALLGAVAYHLSSGSFSNAQHVDIVRGYAWLPWLFWIFSFNFLTQKGRWRIVLASVILFCFLAGSYPGMVVAAFYGNVLLCGTELWGKQAHQIRQYLLKLIGVVAIAVLFSTLKFLPFIVMSNELVSTTGGGIPLSKIKWINLVAIFFRINVEGFLPEDFTVRSLFISPMVILPIAYCLKVSRSVVVGVSLALLALLLAFSWGGSPMVDALLPGMKVSRFHLLDYRGIFQIGLILAACDVLNQLPAAPETIQLSTRWYARLGVTVAVLVILVGAAFNYGYSLAYIWPELSYLIGINAFLFVYPWCRYLLKPLKQALKPGYLVVACILVVLGSVPYIDHFAPGSRFVDYQTVLSRIYQVPYNVIFSKSAKQRDREWQKRPPRLPESFAVIDVSRGFDSQIQFNLSSYVQQFSTGGYDNGNRLKRRAKLQEAQSDKALLTFMTRDSRVLLLPPGEAFSSAQLQGCAESFTCGRPELGKVSIQRFGLNSTTYQIQLNSPARMVENELYYPGWTSEICINDDCNSASIHPKASAQPFGDYSLRSWDLKPGKYTFKTTYLAPFMSFAWLLFWLGVVISIGLLGLDLWLISATPIER